MTVTDPAPTYKKVREQAKNWEHYFAFYGLYSLTGEGDGVEILLADDDRIYRVDTTDAFPISNFQLDAAGIHQTIRGLNPQQVMKENLLSSDLSHVLDSSWCDVHLARCLKICPDSLPYFLGPFARIQEIGDDYIDDFLNTIFPLCKSSARSIGKKNGEGDIPHRFNVPDHAPTV